MIWSPTPLKIVKEIAFRFFEGPLQAILISRLGPSKKRTESNFFHDFQGGGGPNQIFPLNFFIKGGPIYHFR